MTLTVTSGGEITVGTCMCTVLANRALTLKMVKDRIGIVLYFMDFLKGGVMKGV